MSGYFCSFRSACFIFYILLSLTACRKNKEEPALAVNVSTFAPTVPIDFPSDLTIANDGSILVAEQSNSQILKITSEGVVKTIAGDGTKGYVDGIGTQAKFNEPWSIAVAGDGTIFVADSFNHRIRKITTTGVVSTLAGSTYGYQDGTGSEAKFYHPSGIAIAKDGTLYISDSGNSCIRKITPSGVVSTVAGDGSSGYADGVGKQAKFSSPTGLDIADDGTLYVVDEAVSNIRKITPTGVVTTLAGGGPAVTDLGYVDGPGRQARFAFPSDITLSPDGNLYVTDQGNHRIRKLTLAGVVTTIAGGETRGYSDGEGKQSRFSFPSGIVAAIDGSLFITEKGNNKIRKITFK